MEIGGYKMPELTTPTQFEITENNAPGISVYTIGDKFTGVINYEVIGKTSAGVTIRIGGISVNVSKRITQ